MSNITCSTITLKDLVAQPEISEMGHSVQLSCINGQLLIVDDNSTMLAENIVLENSVVIAGTDEPPAVVEDDLSAQIVEAGVFQAVYEFVGKVEYVEKILSTGVEAIKKTNYIKYTLNTLINVASDLAVTALASSTSSSTALGQVDTTTPTTGVVFTYTVADQTLDFGYTVAAVISGLTNGRTLISRVTGTRSYKLIKLA